MTESSGSTLTPLVGGVNISLVGATVGVSGKVDGTAVSFDGVDDFGVTASSLDLTAYNKIVVEALMYIPFYDSNIDRVGWQFDPNLSFYYGIDGGLGATTQSNLAIKGSAGYDVGLYSRPTTGSWHHIVTVYDKSLVMSDVSFYIDGILQDAVSRPLYDNNKGGFGDNLMSIMSRFGSGFTNGKIQHLAIYSGLSSEEIAIHANLINTASTITLAGPTSGVTDVTSGDFSVSSDLPISTSITVTPNDNGAGGTFSPTSVIISSTTPTATFTYTSSSTGSKTISVTNDGGLNNPTSITHVVILNIPATEVILSGPTSGSIEVASTNFTVSANGIITGNLTVTPNDNGAGGTFSPTSVIISSTTPTATFTYTPSSIGIKIISVINNQSLINQNIINYSVSMVGSGLILGDSTIATYAGGTQVADFLYTERQVSDGWTATSIAYPGHTITQQKNTYLATGNRSTVDFTIVQIGLNDLLNPPETTSVVIARLQDLIDTINANKKVGSLVIVSTMNPIKQRLIDSYGTENGLISQQQFLDINNATKGFGPTPITGVDYRISKHTSLLDDGNGNLASIYDTGDHVHENNAARQIIAHVWRDSLAELGLLSPTVSSEPIIGTSTIHNGTATINFSAPTYNGGANITSYIAHSNIGNFVSTATTSPIIITGLQNGVSYSFTVAAVNSAGTSEYSTSSNTVLSVYDIFDVNYIVSENGTLSGSSTQSVAYGSSTTAVTATPNAGYRFLKWSDDITTPTRTDSNITQNATITAMFGRRSHSNYITQENITTSIEQDITPIIDNVSTTTIVKTVSTTTPSSPTNITKTNFLFKNNLKLGQTSPDVKELQKFLNSHGYIISKTGPGSIGNETNYFGLLTKKALILFQEANTKEILKPFNLTKGTGYFGEGTRKWINGGII